nr:hypothetical protein [uncultured Desulfobulbus sp.]
MKELDENAMSYLETRIPELAEGAVKQAYCKNLVAGRKVVEAVNGQLIESFPDGTSRVIKTLAAPTPVVPGQRLLGRVDSVLTTPMNK